MTKKYVQSLTLYLSGSGVLVGATSIILTSFTDIYGNALTLADFGDKGYGTLEPDTTNEEAFTFTSVTTNANGTVTLGGVSTALAKSPYTETSGLVRAHSGGTKVVITDNVAFWNTFANVNNANTFVILPQSAATPSANADFATKVYVDGVAVAGAPNAGTATKGIVQEATQAQVDAGTTAGSTGADLFARPDTLRSKQRSDYVASDTGAANAYAFAASPAITAYAAGQTFTFKSAHTNTTTSTLAVNGLAVTTIKKSDGATNLAAGDIVSGQIIDVMYDGTNFQMLSPSGNTPLLPAGSGAGLSGITPAQVGALSIAKTGQTTRAGDTASGSQTIAHGLGLTPKLIRITAYKNISTAATAASNGSYDGTTNACTYMLQSASTSNSATGALAIQINDDGSGTKQSATATVDGTNITLTWTKAGSPNSNPINLLWEAIG